MRVRNACLLMPLARMFGAVVAVLLASAPAAVGQTAYPGSLADYSRPTPQGPAAADWGIPPPGAQEPFPALDPGDRGYDPVEVPGPGLRVPSSCAEPGSACRRCVASAEENIQFNRRYLHVAWSVANSQLARAERLRRPGDPGAPSDAASAQLREVYRRKYEEHMQNIRRSLDELAACEKDNAAPQSLYLKQSQAYYDMLVVRYEKADP
jgi:hypothetical protein